MSQDVFGTTVPLASNNFESTQGYQPTEYQPVIDLNDQTVVSQQQPLSLALPTGEPYPTTPPLLMGSPPQNTAHSQPIPRWIFLLMLVLVILILGIGFIHFTGSSSSLTENLAAFWRELTSNHEAALETHSVREKGPTLTHNTSETETPVTMKDVAPETIANPYWLLPNHIDEKNAPMNGSWTPAQREMWQAGLNHQYPWQRLKTIKAIRAARQKGSEGLLYEALEQKKFWARMEAIFALGDFGFELNLDSVEKALGDASPSLIKNYCKRFVTKHTPGEIYVLRQAIRVVEGPARRQILMGLAQTRGELNDLYLAAAMHDPSPTVKEWLQPYLSENPLSPSTIEKFNAVAMTGESDEDEDSEDESEKGRDYMVKDGPTEEGVEKDQKSLQTVIESVKFFDSTDPEDGDVEIEAIEEPPPTEKKINDGFETIGGKKQAKPVFIPDPPDPNGKGQGNGPRGR